MQSSQFHGFLKLSYVSGLGRVSLQRLGNYFNGNFSQVFDSSHSQLLKAGLTGNQITQIQNPDANQLERELEWLEHPGNHIICYDDQHYPALLKQTINYPPLLYASGNIDLLATPQVAIVGSRHCSSGGAKTAFGFASLLSRSGLTITSGMASGIDAQAHKGALSSNGQTIAVTGTGLDRIYPSSNRQLAYDIHKHGLLVSEFPLGTGPRSENFPRRNRIISGLCVATLVVEATKRSGSLITAQQAAEQGREVFAIPGSIHNPQSRGCHQLIRDGARLVEQASDIIEELGSLLGFIAEQQPIKETDKTSTLDPESQRLLDAIGYDPVSSDTLVERSGLTIDKLSSMLVLLELNDFIQSAPGGCYVRIK
ncbi:MAG: DNA-protecting protein DprA [Gammaproteobacteria bacterium]|nr:DNA-protecting protein DprA [Gammaproteobacteria bacterium]